MKTRPAAAGQRLPGKAEALPGLFCSANPSAKISILDGRSENPLESFFDGKSLFPRNNVHVILLPSKDSVRPERQHDKRNALRRAVRENLPAPPIDVLVSPRVQRNSPFRVRSVPSVRNRKQDRPLPKGRKPLLPRRERAAVDVVRLQRRLEAFYLCSRVRDPRPLHHLESRRTDLRRENRRHRKDCQSLNERKSRAEISRKTHPPVPPLHSAEQSQNLLQNTPPCFRAMQERSTARNFFLISTSHLLLIPNFSFHAKNQDKILLYEKKSKTRQNPSKTTHVFMLRLRKRGKR